MRSLRCYVILIAMLAVSRVYGHGFGLSVDSYGNPTTLIAASEVPFFDNDPVSPLPGPANLFLDAFDGDPNGDGSYPTDEGFAQTSGPFPFYTSATYRVISPLFFSDGTGPAVPASAGTQVHIYNLWAGDPDPVNNPHPGAAFGDVYVGGAASPNSGYGVSLYDFHELEKDLYLGAGSTQTDGEYGFAFTVTVHFAGGQIVTTGPLVDVFATDITTDPDNPGGFATFAPPALQDAATQAIYNAVVPEPSTIVLAGVASGAFIAFHQGRRSCGQRNS